MPDFRIKMVRVVGYALMFLSFQRACMVIDFPKGEDVHIHFLTIYEHSSQIDCFKLYIDQELKGPKLIIFPFLINENYK